MTWLRQNTLLVAAVLCGSCLAGCGSAGTSSPPFRRAVALTGEAAKPPRRILADGAAALRRVHSWVMRGTVTVGQDPLQVEIRVHDLHSVEMALASYGASAEMISVPSGSFVRGNTGYWIDRMGRRGSLFADRWIQVTRSAAAEMVGAVRQLSPSSVSRCFTEHHGTLTVAGMANIEGQPAVLITDAGNVPGSTPEEIAVAATGSHYPLQLTTTGPRHPGGGVDGCNGEDQTGVLGTVTFGQFGAVAPIQAPAQATRLDQSADT